MLIRTQNWEDVVSEIGIRICFILGIFSFISYFIFVFLPDNTLIHFATKLAKSMDSERVAYAGLQRLQFELNYVIKRLKLVLPVLTFLVLLWSILWRVLYKKGIKEITKSDKLSSIYASISYPVLLGIIFFAILIRFINFKQPLWYDEIYTITNFINTRSFLKTIMLNRNYNNHILYSIISRIFMLYFGKAEWIFRLPSLIFGATGIWALARLAGLLGNKNIVWISVILLTFSPLHIDFSQQARGYTALVFFSILSCYFFLLAINKEKIRSWWGFVAASVCGLYSHLYMIMVLLSQAAVVLFGTFFFKTKGLPLIKFKTADHFFLYSTIVMVITFLLYIPVLPFLVFDQLRNNHQQIVNFDFIFGVFRIMGSGRKGMDLGITYLILFFSGIFFMWRKVKIIAILAIALFATPFTVLFMIKPPVILTRYFIFVLPLYLIFIAAGIYCISKVLNVSKQAFIVIIITLFVIIMSWPSTYTILTNEKYKLLQTY